MSGALKTVLNGAVSALRSLDRRFRGPGLMEFAVLSLAVAAAFMVRVLPGRWGPVLSEFDPWWHYTIATMIIERGWSGFFEFRNLVDTMSWHPTGLNVGSTFYPGVAFAMAFIHLLLSSLGISVSPLELAAILPVFYGMVTVVVIYLFARYALGRGPALASALLLSVSNAHISRTHYGWFDDEALSIPLMHAGFLLYLVAIDEKRSLKGAAVYGLLAGLALGGVVAAWGAHRFAIVLIPAFTALLVFLGRFRPTLLAAYLPAFATYTAVAVSVPKLGPQYLTELSLAVGWLAIAYLLLGWYAYRRFDEVRRLLVLRGVVIAGAVMIVVLTFLGSLDLPGLKFFSVLVPTLRGALPIVQSVAENQMATWASLFLDFGPTLPLALLGIYLLVKRGTDGAVFLMLYAAAALYAAGSMVRLALPTSPLVAVLAGLGLSHVLESSFSSAFAAQLKRPSIHRRALVAVPLAVLMVLSLYYLPSGAGNPLQVSGIDAANVPPTVLTSSVPTKQLLLDWVRTSEWMKYNLPPTAVVASWWDYGNWISRLGERKSIIDNTTIDNKRIALIGYAFMSPPNVSRAIFKELGATHVLIFITFAPFIGGTTGGQLLFFGDESKWYWMLKIANQEARNLGLEPIDENSLLGPEGSPVNAQEKFWEETTLGLMIPYRPVRVRDQSYYVYDPSEIPGFRLVFSSSPPYSTNTYAYIYIYEIVD